MPIKKVSDEQIRELFFLYENGIVSDDEKQSYFPTLEELAKSVKISKPALHYRFKKIREKHQIVTRIKNNQLSKSEFIAGLEVPDKIIGLKYATEEYVAKKKQLKKESRTVDEVMLIAYCLSYQHWIEAERDIRENGYTVVGKSKKPEMSPSMIISQKERRLCIEYADALGFSLIGKKKLKLDQEQHKMSELESAAESWGLLQ